MLVNLVNKNEKSHNGFVANANPSEVTPEPPELLEEHYWNKWVAIGKQGIVGANPSLVDLLDDLENAGLESTTGVTTLFNTPPDDNLVIPTQFFE